MPSLSVNGTKVPTRSVPMRHHKAGKSFTRTGYGRRLPLEYMVQWNGKWRRVYCCCFSNSGTAYIEGPKGDDGKTTWLIVNY